MNPSIKKLAETSLKKRKKIIGLMSGTSLDGLDIALCEIQGSGSDTVVNLKHFITKPYGEHEKRRLKNISSVKTVELSEVCYLHTWLAGYHSKLILTALEKWGIEPSEIDCIASHGQTIYHFPSREQTEKEFEKFNSTLQIGDGDHIAYKTGILTISDFRQKHTSPGGEGAPMAALVDRILFSDPDESRILLNIGGIANFTIIPAGKKDSRDSFTTDTGPGNTMIDNLVQRYYSLEYDEDGKIAKSGQVNHDLLGALLSDSYFETKETASTGPEHFNFNWLNEKAEGLKISLEDIPVPDIIRTVTELSAITVTDRIRKLCLDDKYKIYISGGGMHNTFLINRIRDLLRGVPIKSIGELGVDPDAKEAVVFAVLANEMLSGSGFGFGPARTGRLNFGKISFPE
ncbi:MAG: anhydro-N-acetylmuramic acid kinase [Balneolaceae bacterium]